MDNNLETKELKEKIQAFCERKHFDNPFIQECITEFVEGHTELFGDVVSTDELFERLETNLDKITFATRENAPNGELGEYKGRIADNKDINEILLYSNESDLDLSETDKKMWSLYTEKDKQSLIQSLEERKADLKSTLLHELTHAAYTIKGDYGIGEKHIFSETSKDIISGEYRQIGSNNNNVEAIVNYISSRIEGKKPDEVETYPAETKAIYMLAEKVDEKSIIQAAWNSNEEQLKQSYIEALGKGNEIGTQSYNGFQDGMKKLVTTRSQNLSLSESNTRNEQTLSELQQLFDGKSVEIESNKFKDIEHKPLQETPDISHKEKTNLSFSQRIAKFFEKHQSLMNVPFVKKFVDRQLNVLPPAREQEQKDTMPTLNDKRIEFVNELSNNGELRKIAPLQHSKENQELEQLHKLVIEETERE